MIFCPKTILKCPSLQSPKPILLLQDLVSVVDQKYVPRTNLGRQTPPPHTSTLALIARDSHRPIRASLDHISRSPPTCSDALWDSPIGTPVGTSWVKDAHHFLVSAIIPPDEIGTSSVRSSYHPNSKFHSNIILAPDVPASSQVSLRIS